MRSLKHKFKKTVKPPKDPVVNTGRVSISKAKYGEEPCDYCELPSLYMYHNKCAFDKAINEMEEEYRENQVNECENKYPLGMLNWVKEKLYSIFRCININVTVAFFVRRNDISSFDAVKCFKSIFEKAGLVVDIEHSESRWYRIVRRKKPILAHCASEVSSNPIVDESVKIAIFDFDDSLELAKKAIAFCDVSLGHRSGFYAVGNSSSYFMAFYKAIVAGQGVLDAYNSLCGRFSITPVLTKKVQDMHDIVIASNFLKERYD